jgi:hypothetical protein
MKQSPSRMLTITRQDPPALPRAGILVKDKALCLLALAWAP